MTVEIVHFFQCKIYGNCLMHRLVGSITIRRTSGLGMKAPD